MSITRHPQWQQFIQEFNHVATHRHRYEVFKDFVLMSAITMHNSIVKDQRLETEYLQIVGRYSKQEMETFCQLFARLILLLDTEPYDVLGVLFMSLDLGNTHVGQFFTPPEVSELMGRINYGEELREIPEFVTLSEPACGAGGMVLAFVKVMLDYGHNPAHKLWVHCQDIDRLAAMMCYLQLALWNIPAVVVVGNSLTMETREVLYTPQHHLGLWRHRLKRRDQEEADRETDTPDNKKQQTQTTTKYRAESAREEMTPIKFRINRYRQALAVCSLISAFDSPPLVAQGYFLMGWAEIAPTRIRFAHTSRVTEDPTRYGYCPASFFAGEGASWQRPTRKYRFKFAWAKRLQFSGDAYNCRMTALNLKKLDPAQLMPIPEVPESYGPRNAEDRRVYKLIKEAFDADVWHTYATVEDFMKVARAKASR